MLKLPGHNARVQGIRVTLTCHQLVVQARAEAEAARALASYAIREADIIREQACIEEEQQRVTAEAAALAGKQR